MDLPAPTKPWKVNHVLPYWAVLLMDVRQTCRSWVFRFTILATAFISGAYLMHRVAVHHQARMIQPASSLVSIFLQFSLIVGTTLVIILTAGAISSERGIMTDSVLSRGISRYQFFMGKWHSRLFSTMGSYALIFALIVTGSWFLLENDISLSGTLLAMIIVLAVMSIVISCSLLMSSLCNSTVLSIAVAWMLIHSTGIVFWLLQYSPFDPTKLYRMLPALVTGQYNYAALWPLLGWSLLTSIIAALIGLTHFARRDI